MVVKKESSHIKNIERSFQGYGNTVIKQHKKVKKSGESYFIETPRKRSMILTLQKPILRHAASKEEIFVECEERIEY